MAFSPVAPRSVLMAMVLTALAGGSAAIAAPAPDFLVAPGFVKGKPMSPDNHPRLPVLFVFVHPDGVEIRNNVKKMEATLGKVAGPRPRVVLVGSGMNASQLRAFIGTYGVTHMDAVADPINLMAAQAGIKVEKEACWHLRTLGTNGKLDAALDEVSFIKEWQQAYADMSGREAAKPEKEKKEAPDAVPNKKLKEPYLLVKQGKLGSAAAKFRSAVGTYKVTDTATADEAKGELAKLEKALADQLEASRINTSDKWVSDLEDAKDELTKWKDYGPAKEKIEKFIKEREALEEVKKEYAARRMRAVIITKLVMADKPNRAAVQKGFEELAKIAFGTPTGDQAAHIARALK